ncbi:MFS transporter [Niallia sp.]|uniref:MFS transporter n=1 Tax=Niallia sp. TaxID=2837523 RepID=UPI00289B0D46|nr:MFS transporter [Niallia sp.]
MTKNKMSYTEVGGETKAEDKKYQSILLLLSVCTGAFLSHFSAGFVNIALTDISIDFSAKLSVTQWIVNGYLLSIMLFLPLMGKLADQFGKKRVHNVGYLIFAAGACGSALSPSIPMLIIARVIQGSGAAMLQAVNMAIVTDAYSEKHRGKALGIISTSVGIGALLGPSVGGFFIDAYSWHMLFWAVVPISIGAYFLAQKFVPMDRSFQDSRFDYKGSVYFGVGIVSFVFVLNAIGEGVFKVYLLGIACVSVACFLFFFFHSRKEDHPFIQPSIFSSPIVKAGGLILMVSYCAAFASTVILPFYLRGVLGFSADQSGLLLMCYPLFLAVLGPISGSLSDRFGGEKVVAIGLGLLGITMLGLSFLSPGTSLPILISLLSLLGFSMGILTSPNYSIMMLYVPLQFLGMMSSTIALLRNIGMVIGTALAITFMNTWLDGTITDWMNDTRRSEFEAVMLGFHYLFLLLFFLIVLSGIYFLYSVLRRKIQEEREFS